MANVSKLSVRNKIGAIMIHGRSRLQRYSKLADWSYILSAARSQDPSLPYIPIIGNGDVFSWEDWKEHEEMISNCESDDIDKEGIKLVNCPMIGRGALIKPWLPSELKEKRHIDISASERLDIVKKYVDYGLEHWGSDQQGVNITRRFLLEWMSYLCRYVPVGIIEHSRLPQKINQRPPRYYGRDDLETLLSSPDCKDWIKISEMFLGPVKDDFVFTPKHKSNSYDV